MTLSGAFSGFGAINGHLFSAEKEQTIFTQLFSVCTKRAVTSAGLCALTNFLKVLRTLSISHAVAVAMNI